jgi:hypothetical protein
VVNLDRYQVVLGTPFLKQQNIMLNYAGSGSFKLEDRWFHVREGEFSKPLLNRGESTEVRPPRSMVQWKKPSSGYTQSSKGKNVEDEGKPKFKLRSQ